MFFSIPFFFLFQPNFPERMGSSRDKEGREGGRDMAEVPPNERSYTVRHKRDDTIVKGPLALGDTETFLQYPTVKWLANLAHDTILKGIILSYV